MLDFTLCVVLLLLVATFATFLDKNTGKKCNLGCSDKSLDKCLSCDKKCSYHEVAEMIMELESMEE